MFTNKQHVKFIVKLIICTKLLTYKKVIRIMNQYINLKQNLIYHTLLFSLTYAYYGIYDRIFWIVAEEKNQVNNFAVHTRVAYVRYPVC